MINANEARMWSQLGREVICDIIDVADRRIREASLKGETSVEIHFEVPFENDVLVLSELSKVFSNAGYAVAHEGKNATDRGYNVKWLIRWDE